MEWWKTAYDNKWISKDELREVVITKSNPYGDITKGEYKEITGVEY